MAGDEEPSGKRNRPSADEKEEVGNDTFQDSKMYGEFDEQQNDTGEEQVNLLHLNIPRNVIILFIISDVVINKVSEIGDDTSDDGSSTQNSVQNATNSSKSSADGSSCILRKFINYCQGL